MNETLEIMGNSITEGIIEFRFFGRGCRTLLPQNDSEGRMSF